MLKNQITYDISASNSKEQDSNIKEIVLATKIKVIITDHDTQEDEEILFFDDMLKLQKNEKVSNHELLTALGSVRGVKSQVKARIEQFLTGNVFPKNSDEVIIETKSQKKTIEEKKIVVYTTSLGIIRKTRADCLYVINAFRNLMLKTEERDIVSEYYRKEYCEKFPNIKPPQIIINSFHIGGRKELEQLIESGDIHLMTRNIGKVQYTANKCSKCLGFGYLNCPSCLGSGRSRTLRVGKTRELSYLKCSSCKEGLVRCMECLDYIS